MGHIRYDILYITLYMDLKFEIIEVFRLSSQYSVIQLPFIFGIAKIKNITIACLIITNHFRDGFKDSKLFTSIPYAAFRIIYTKNMVHKL